VRYGFIKRHDGEFGVGRMCAALGVSRSGYYAWRDGSESARALADRELLGRIQKVHQESREAYGAYKTWQELRAQGVRCGKHRVARLRKLHGIEARRTRRFRVTVENHTTLPAAPNLLQRRFQSPQRDRVWVGDMTFIRTRAGFLHLAVLLDLYSRRVVGWSMSERPDLGVVLGALRMAIESRSPAAGLIHHTDQGPIYSSNAYRDLLSTHHAVRSMSGKGNAYDNAVAESFFSNLKNELVHHCDFESRDAARAAIFDYIEIFYNRIRRHQTLGYVSPVAFEKAGSES
jgi:transposase InsO family protein